MFFDEADKIGNIFVSQLVGDFFYLAGGGQQQSSCFKDDLLIDQGRSGLAERCFCNRIQLVKGEFHFFCIG